MNILQTLSFKKHVKQLHKSQKKYLDQIIEKISKDPSIGNIKKGDLSGIQVYKFKMVNQSTLLAYKFNKDEIQLILLALGPHENFYRDLKR